MTILNNEKPSLPTKVQQVVSPTSATTVKSRINGFGTGGAAAIGDKRAVTLIVQDQQQHITQIVADILGKPWRLVQTYPLAEERDTEIVTGIVDNAARDSLKDRDRSLAVLINTHCVHNDSTPDEYLSRECDYEFLYSQTPFFRRDLARFLSIILGQVDHHENLIKKTRTTFISTTFPDVTTALPNLDILSVGSDAVELRVDLLKEPRSDGTFNPVPSLKYVGEQVMLLRQRTELPIIYTTRCTRENGRFPMDDPELYYKYLYRAMQWGCEYIDIELWLPEDTRKMLAEKKGNSKIISAFHDFSGKFKWPSPEAQTLFEQGARYGDIVKMIALVDNMSQNYELEYFRSTIKANYPHPPLSAVNMGQTGQMSRALNTVFSPITHPLLPMIAAPGQLSAAEINEALHFMGQLPKKDIYAIGNFRSSPQAVFFEKCFNELGLPHHFACVDCSLKGSFEGLIMQSSFGGAYMSPPLPIPQSYIDSLSDAAQAIGVVDTIVVHTDGDQRALVGENATWKGVRATLTWDFVPSAYCNRAALVLASSQADAASAIFALRSLNIGIIYTVGFKAHGQLAVGLEPFTSLECVQRGEQPFVVISALSPEKSHLVQPLLRHFGNSSNGKKGAKLAGKVFIDLANGSRKGDPLGVAAASGWTAYSIADVGAWTTVETLRLLVGQNVPQSFVRLASGRGFY
ncbi:MAG: hypothetical protein M1827_002974 [Pycnora praestabilis]|nr:MAG: hypothetical protein M1827_002974 [Pycnora praestabilis]